MTWNEDTEKDKEDKHVWIMDLEKTTKSAMDCKKN